MSIGTADEPFDSTAEIRLYGNNTSPSQFVFSPSIPVGTKNMIVTGKLDMFGTPRQRVTRLLRSVYPGDTSILVDLDFDYVNGDQLGLPATNNDPYNSETVIVESYDAGSGLVVLVNPATGYHFGDPKSTGD